MHSLTVPAIGASPRTRSYAGSFVRYDPSLTPHTGSRNATMLLCALAFRSNGYANPETGWFDFTLPEIEEATDLKRTTVRTARELLENAGYIEYLKFGVPARGQWRITERGHALLAGTLCAPPEEEEAPDDEPEQGGGGGGSIPNRQNLRTGKPQSSAPDLTYRARQKVPNSPISLYKEKQRSEAKNNGGGLASQNRRAPAREEALTRPTPTRPPEYDINGAGKPFVTARPLPKHDLQASATEGPPLTLDRTRPNFDLPPETPDPTPKSFDYNACARRFEALPDHEQQRLLQEARRMVGSPSHYAGLANPSFPQFEHLYKVMQREHPA